MLPSHLRLVELQFLVILANLAGGPEHGMQVTMVELPRYRCPHRFRPALRPIRGKTRLIRKSQHGRNANQRTGGTESFQ